MPLAAWIGAAAIGGVLGVLGAGGSILTVPALVFLAGQPHSIAVAESLVIVGAIAATGGIAAAIRGRVDAGSVVWFGVPGMIATSVGAQAGVWAGGSVQWLAFTGVLLAAATLMLRRRRAPATGTQRAARGAMVLRGSGVGVITGFVGVGGGFLIVPALVLLGPLPITMAVGTSLVIIAMNAGVGFWTYQALWRSTDVAVDWTVVAAFATVGIAGALGGQAAGSRLSPQRLQRAFAVVLLVIAAAMVWRQIASLA